jgi:outer membrane protein TolC
MDFTISLKSTICIYKKQLIHRFAFAVLLLIGTDAANAQPFGDSLLLQQAVEVALERSPSVQASRQRLVAYEGYAQSARGIFNTSYSLFAEKSMSRTPSTIIFREGILGAPKVAYDEFRSFRYGLDASKLLSSGLVVSAGAGLTNYGKDDLYRRLLLAGRGELITNRATAYLNLSQPLLRGRGKSFQMAGVQMADFRLGAQAQQFYYDVSVEVLEVLLGYVDYVTALKNLEIQRQTEERFVSTVRDLDRLVELDALPRAETLFIRANTASQTNNRVYAENNLAYLRNALGARMGLGNGEISQLPMPTAAFPIEDISLPDTAYLSRWLDESLKARPDYQSLLQVIEANAVEVAFNRQRMQPRLDLHAGISYNGIHEGSGLSQYGASFATNVPGMNYSVGISMALAPAFDQEKGDLLASTAQLDAARHQAQALENGIHLNVKRYYDQLRYFQQVVVSARQAVGFNETALNNEYTKLKLGSSTVLNVVQIQNNYVLSLNALNRALQDLNTAFFLFKFHTGTLLERDGQSVWVDYDRLLSLP